MPQAGVTGVAGVPPAALFAMNGARLREGRARARGGRVAAWTALAAVALLGCGPAPADGDGGGVLTVHVVAHSHCDAGYKKTFRGYHDTEVSRILTSVTAALRAVPDRTFIWSESSFLQAWLEGAGRAHAADFKALVQEGRIEIVGGGWVMHDEAATTHYAQVRQMQVGHTEVLQPFFGDGFRVKHGWQIDPFGQGTWSPTLMALSGFDAWVINRIGDLERDALKADRGLQFLWKGNEDLPDVDSQVLTHVLDTHYNATALLDWETPGDAAPPVTPANVQALAEVYVAEVVRRSKWYRYPALLAPFGDDFRFQNATLQFEIMDKIMAHINANQDLFQEKFGVKIAMQYSTLAMFFDDLAKHEPVFPQRGAQTFLPITDHDLQAWSGFYSGFPALKRLARACESLYRTTEGFYAALVLSTGRRDAAVEAQLEYSRKQVGLLQHHDALPATGYGLNNQDYMHRLRKARDLTRSALEAAVTGLQRNGTAGPEPPYELHLLEDPVVLSEGAYVQLAVACGHPRSVPPGLVRVKVNRPDVMVFAATGTAVPSQVVKDASEDSKYDLYFAVRDVPPGGVATFYLSTCVLTHWTDPPFPRDPAECAAYSKHVDYAAPTPGPVAQNERYEVRVGEDLGVEIVDRRLGADSGTMRLEWAFYNATVDNVYKFDGQQAPVPIPATVRSVAVQEGPLAVSVAITLSDSIALDVLLVRGSATPLEAATLRMQVRVGPLPPFQDFVGRITTGIASDGLWYAENGYQLHRSVYDPEKRAGQNFKPTSRASLEDDRTTLTLVAGQILAATSPRPGQLEVMLHRRVNDENFLRGNASPRGDDSAVAVVDLHLHAGPRSDDTAVETALLSEIVSQPPRVLTRDGPLLPQGLPWTSPPAVALEVPPGPAVPYQVQVLSCYIPQRRDGKVVVHLQLEHRFAADETKGVPVSFHVAQAVPALGELGPVEVEEMSLTYLTTAAAARARRLWTSADRPAGGPAAGPGCDLGGGWVRLMPKAVCTLQISAASAAA